MAFTITSPVFEEGGIIPAKYTCDGQNISPPLQWTGAPKGTKSFALISDDPDAPIGIWVHWIIWNIPAEANQLPENIPQVEKLQDGSMQGLNSYPHCGYSGPCPPSGTHRYYFKLYALDTMLDLSAESTNKDLLKAMKNNILAQTSIMGKYQRQ
ncbi:MAG: YbhB/YbcL family Raf kinase inhibitor-like protein [Phycisphaerae bacterium]|nr:YbhB/YbcL family Raf kinase inhibitor-like protein [Phycisphaerae bacterium]